jgi:hypothetical protein
MKFPTLSSIPARFVDLSESSPSRTVALLASRLLVALGLVAQLFVAWRFWSITWDDSAITLGFARTLALTGRIEPTPGSGIVEGYSTTLWMLLMSLVAKIVVGPAIVLAVAKVSTLLLNLASILLMRRWFSSWSPENLANIIAGSVGCGLMFFETINGMETPLFLTLVFVMLFLLPIEAKTGRLLYLAAGCAFLLLRWEAIWLLVPFVLVDTSARRARVAATTWLGTFVASNAIRWYYFGSILPNTIIAKHGEPYSFPTHIRGESWRHLQEPLLIIWSCKVMLLLTAACLIYDNLVLRASSSPTEDLRQALHKSWQLRFTTLFMMFSLILTTAIGTNWGPPLRSFYTGWPFLFCFLLLPVLTSVRVPGLGIRLLPWVTVLLCVFACWRMGRLLHEMRRTDSLFRADVTVNEVASMAYVLGDLEKASRHSSMLFAGPDMGGIMLYAQGVRLIDLGLLCDPVLAHQRYKAIDSYVLQQRKPDVIEVHALWTALTDFQAYPEFRVSYRPVYVDGMRVFVTRDLLHDIAASRLTEWHFGEDGSPEESVLNPHSYIRYEAADLAVNRMFGTYLVLR